MKIALLGTAPSSLRLAPMGDPEWTIWACSPGCADYLPELSDYRVDAWFELHDWNEPTNHEEYKKFLAEFPNPVYLIEAREQIPSSLTFPRQEMVDRFGPYFFTSTLAWMLGYAIAQEPEEIGFWGVDMSACEEWAQQRPGCHHFIWLAQESGIKITAPPQSDLLCPPPQYGYTSHMRIKLQARRAELASRISAATKQRDEAQQQIVFLSGALEDIDYTLNTWAG